MLRKLCYVLLYIHTHRRRKPSMRHYQCILRYHFRLVALYIKGTVVYLITMHHMWKEHKFCITTCLVSFFFLMLNIVIVYHHQFVGNRE